MAAAQAAGDVKEALGFFNTFLLAFAAVALFVGSFIIFNTFTIIVAQRLRELALLRALGASRKQVTRSVLAEALIVGLRGLGHRCRRRRRRGRGLEGLLAAFGMDLPSHTLVIKPRTIVVPMLVGVVITTLASWGPARKASKVPPVAAIRGADEIPEGRTLRRRIIAGGVVLGLGMLALAGGLFGGGGIGLVGLGALIFYGGVAMLSPLVAGPLSRLIGAPAARFRGIPGRLGRLNAMRNPRRTASTAAALMIGLGLVSFVTILAASLEDVVRRHARSEHEGRLHHPGPRRRAVPVQPGGRPEDGAATCSSRSSPRCASTASSSSTARRSTTTPSTPTPSAR